MPLSQKRGHKGSQTAKTKDRAAEAVALRVAGLSYETIAARLGYAGRSGAYEAVKALLDKREAEGVEALRKVEAERLDAIVAGHLGPAQKGNTESARVVIEASRQRARIFGFEAKRQVELEVTGLADLLASAFQDEPVDPAESDGPSAESSPSLEE
jgi:hypothetical protein